MPSHLSADRPAAQPPGRGSVEALISQARRLRGDVDAVRRDTRDDVTNPRGRWQRALCDLALRQLHDLDEHLSQLRDGPEPAPRPGSLLSRVGCAEWNLLTDGADWSGELYQILGRDPATPPLTLDELPSLVLDADRPKLTAMVTDCLVDARPIDGEFRIVRPDGDVRLVHMMGEPVLDADGSTVSMWAVLRDVSELRRSQRVVSETRDSLQGHPQDAGTGKREAAVPPRHGLPRFPRQERPGLDLAGGYLPSAVSAPGTGWYDACPLGDGDTLLGVGEFTGPATGEAAGTAMLIGALRGMAAVAETRPEELLSRLAPLLDAAALPPLHTAVCCAYRTATRTLRWAHTGHPAPLLFRNGTGRRLDGQPEETLQAGDLLLLYTGALVPGHGGAAAVNRLLALAPRLAGARSAQDGVGMVTREFDGSGGTGREHEACVLVARVTS
ncbi:SpoIIE family protein phosphatase [Streptomyces sp. TRM S81-3]|uniref:SpoIIE family protein phosphatase n=1 Tax=Streptomyces griseicoloratus TaxID=2752516 RepID=A0A926L6A5_9ACTN|nr:SpoIIE family protein phosphatase [Streptomyces griseicoloratus]MBD0422780.1 SpoIIE family protein phosphatase [Streptomyces griseicoloratus]